jgi:hypothetical protein
MNWTPAAQITPLCCCGAFFSERLWLVLHIQASHHQNLHGQLAYTQEVKIVKIGDVMD